MATATAPKTKAKAKATPTKTPARTAAAPRTRVATGARTAARAARPAADGAARVKQAQRAAILFKQVSDPTRLSVILMLSEGERHVGSLCDEFAMSQPAVSHHLALLRHGGIISPRREGKQNFYGLTDLGHRLSRMVKAMVG